MVALVLGARVAQRYRGTDVAALDEQVRRRHLKDRGTGGAGLLVRLASAANADDKELRGLISGLRTNGAPPSCRCFGCGLFRMHIAIDHLQIGQTPITQ